jgi:carbon-monoxide dehydrogenase large subunit/6-hydroxypseudooxynicotine dehydrogenase subunit gamma
METALAQICAETLGVDYRRVRVVHGQTDRIAFGLGAFASRVTVMTGEATRIAATKVRAKALAAAAALLQNKPEALDVIDGKVVSRASPQGPSVALGAVARALGPASKLLGDDSPGLTAEAWIEQTHMAYPYGVHVAVVRIDRGTGGVIVERYVVAYDIGRAVNPMLVEGQIAGGLAQGLGGALFEAIDFADGRIRNGTMEQYRVPRFKDVPVIETILINREDIASAGAGESSLICVAPAIGSAVRAFGKVETALPIRLASST